MKQHIREAQGISSICAVRRLLRPWGQTLPGRRHYTSGLKSLERRIHSTSRSKLYSRIKEDTDFQSARAPTWFMVMLPSAFHDTRWLKTHTGRGRAIRASSRGCNTTASFPGCLSPSDIGYAFSVELQNKNQRMPASQTTYCTGLEIQMIFLLMLQLLGLLPNKRGERKPPTHCLL